MELLHLHGELRLVHRVDLVVEVLGEGEDAVGIVELEDEGEVVVVTEEGGAQAPGFPVEINSL